MNVNEKAHTFTHSQLAAHRAELLIAARKSAEHIDRLCTAIFRISTALSNEEKVQFEDWAEASRNATELAKINAATLAAAG